MQQTDQGRIAQIDVLRGFAVLGVYWVGAGAFGLPYGANALPTLLGTPSDLNLAIWASTEVYVSGAMRGLFSMLFGASALIFLEEGRLHSGGLALVDRFYRRNLTLMLFGIVHAYLLLWPHDVLYAYGLLGMFLFPLRRVRPLVLFLIGVAMLSLVDLEIDWSLVLDWLRGLPSPEAVAAATTPEESARFLNWLRMQMAEDIQTYRSGYLDIFAAQVAEVAAQQSTVFYKRHLFEIGGMMLIGMALYRWGVLSGQRSTRTYLWLALLGFAVGGWMRGANLYQAYLLDFDPLTLVQLEEARWGLGRLPVVLGHVGLIGLLCRWARAGWLTGSPGRYRAPRPDQLYWPDGVFDHPLLRVWVRALRQPGALAACPGLSGCLGLPDRLQRAVAAVVPVRAPGVVMAVAHLRPDAADAAWLSRVRAMPIEARVVAIGISLVARRWASGEAAGYETGFPVWT